MPGSIKDYILVMLFLKYISDLWNDHVAAYRQRFGDDEARIRRRLERERFVLPVGASFYDLYEQRNEANIGERINVALEEIEDANRAKLDGVFRNIDFNSEANLGRTKDRNRRLRNLLEDFAKDATRVEWCDTLNGPALGEGDHLMTFDVVVANPPFSLDKWGRRGRPRRPL
jgi:type I restriction enzyme M protein